METATDLRSRVSYETLPEGRRPFGEHLEELRRRLLRGLLWLAAATALSWIWAPRLLAWLIEPIGQVVFLSPAEPFLVHLKAALLGGLALGSPGIAWECWSFVRPALRPAVRPRTIALAAASAALFLAGAWLGWRLLLPTSLKILLGFRTEFMVPMLSVGAAINFAFWLIAGCGLVFQIPLGIFVLCSAGWVRPVTLIRQWRLAAVALLILAAILTPGPDIVSQLILTAPLAGLYLVSVGLAWLAWRR